MAKKANFFDSILTGDEKLIAFDNTHRGLQWLDPDQVPEGTPKPHKFVKKVIVRNCAFGGIRKESCITRYWKAVRRLIATYTVCSLSE